MTHMLGKAQQRRGNSALRRLAYNGHLPAQRGNVNGCTLVYGGHQ